MASTKLKPRNVFIDEQLYDWVRRYARSHRVTISAIVREALEEYARNRSIR